MVDQNKKPPLPGKNPKTVENNPLEAVGSGNFNDILALKPDLQDRPIESNKAADFDFDLSQGLLEIPTQAKPTSLHRPQGLLDAIADLGMPFAPEQDGMEPQRQPAPEITEILVIEPQNGIEALFETYIATADENQRIFVMSLPQTKILLDVAAQRKVNIDERLIYLKTLDLQLDEMLYSSVKRLSRLFVDCLKTASAELGNDEWALLAQPSELALAVGLVDRFAGVIRPFLQLRNVIASHPATRIRFIAKPYTRIDALEHYFKSMGAENFEIITSHLGKLEPQSSSPMKLLNGKQNFRRGKNYDFEKIASALSEKAAFFAVNLPEVLYGKTFEAIAAIFRKTPHKYAVFCSSHLEYMEGISRYGHDFGKCFFRKIDATDLIEIRSLHPEAEAILLAAIDAFVEKALLEKGGENATAYLLANYLYTQTPHLLSLIREMTEGFERLMAKCSVVATIPGRIMESNILCGLAKKIWNSFCLNRWISYRPKRPFHRSGSRRSALQRLQLPKGLFRICRQG